MPLPHFGNAPIQALGNHSEGYIPRFSLSTNELGLDAWGRAKTMNDFSQFHGVFTFDVPDKMWIEYTDDVEVSKTNCTSVNGALRVASDAGNTKLVSKRHPRYQPNRGMLYSTAIFLDNATIANGKLYAVTRTTIDSVIVEDRQEILLPNGYNPAKGHIYDIQAQWRGVGGLKFFIDNTIAYHFDYLGTLDELSISNPALAISFEADDSGTLRFGSYDVGFGMFFEWVFDTPDDCSLRCGCVDITSEGGTDEKQQFVSAVGEEITVSDSPILAIRIPSTLNGIINTRDVQLSRIKVDTAKKGKAEIYYTRDTTCLTLNGITWTPINGGSIEVATPTSASQLTMDKNKADMIDLLPIQALVNNVADNPNDNKIDFYLTHGDYLIINGIAAASAMQAVIQLGEEL